MKILFINGSPNKNGNTAALAEALLKGKEYETLCSALWDGVCRNGHRQKPGKGAWKRYLKH